MWINMDNRFLDMMAREKEMSTAITWKASEGWMPSSSGICVWQLDLAETLEGSTAFCKALWSLLPVCLLWWLGGSRPLWVLQLYLATDTCWAFYRMCRELWIPMKTCTIDTKRERKTQGTSEWIQGISTDLLKNGLWPIWSWEILV